VIFKLGQRVQTELDIRGKGVSRELILDLFVDGFEMCKIPS
jgi:hypothetical protein|tara:strand:+ start:540 stop:662 length:123 start_codon:yes stop_codon:yes gene_type:complete